MTDVIIDLGNASNGDTDVAKGDQVTFRNTMNNRSVTLVLPRNQGGNSPFSGNPTSPVTLRAGDSSSRYTINAGANGDYSYSWTVERDASAAPRTGRIVVG